MKYSFIIVILIAFFTFACKSPEKEETESTESISRKEGVSFTSAQVNNAGIKYGDIEKVLLSKDINARGELIINTEGKALATPVFDGIVGDIYINSGNKVTKGQKLAGIYSLQIIEMQNEFLQNRNLINMLKADYERQKLLQKESLNASKTFEKVEADYFSARNRYSALEKMLILTGIDIKTLEQGDITDCAYIKSPISGYINEIYLETGQHAGPGSPFCKIIDNNELYIELMVFEKDIIHVKTGQRLSFKISDRTGTEFDAKISSIGSSVISDARVVPVYAVPDEQFDGLREGMFVTGKIHTYEEEFDALPEEAVVINNDGLYYIYYTLTPDNSDEYVFYELPVETGFVEDGFIAVNLLADLPENARIVVKGSYYIKSARLNME